MKNQMMIITIVITLCSMLVGCSGSGGNTALKEGGIYSFKNNNGAYSVLKILKVESGGLHIRVYSNQFDSPPTKVEESMLYMAGRNPKPNEILSEPDVALLKKSFDNYKATFVQQSTVKDDELEVYKAWKQAGGQYY
jgi:hypothetical protein